MALIGLPATATIILVLSWAAIPLEIILAVYLWAPRRRGSVAVLGVCLHIGMVVLLYRMRLDLDVFALVMWGLYLLFLGPAAVPRQVRWSGAGSGHHTGG